MNSLAAWDFHVNMKLPRGNSLIWLMLFEAKGPKRFFTGKFRSDRTSFGFRLLFIIKKKKNCESYEVTRLWRLRSWWQKAGETIETTTQIPLDCYHFSTGCLLPLRGVRKYSTHQRNSLTVNWFLPIVPFRRHFDSGWDSSKTEE